MTRCGYMVRMAEVHHKLVQERLGHSNAQMMLNLYSRVSESLSKRVTEAIGE